MSARQLSDADRRRLALGVLMAGVPGPEPQPWLVSALRDGLASVCLFAENTPDVAAARHLTDRLREAAPDLLVAVDEEGGDVTRLQHRLGSQLPAASALDAAGDDVLSRRYGATLGALCAACGANLDLAPVLDVASEPRNPVIGVRSFGADASTVARHARAVVAGLHEAGVAACGKHFPGHGDTLVDSHAGLPRVDADAETLRERELAPFGDLLPDLDAVMVAHLLVPALGEGIATLAPWSYRWLWEHGFDGLLVTDALGMRAVTPGDDVGPAVVAALRAGADLLCLDAPHNRDARGTLEQAVGAIGAGLCDGVLDPDALERSAGRTRALSRRVPVTSAPLTAAAGDDLGVDVGDAIVARALHTQGDLSGRRWALLDLRAGINAAAGYTAARVATGFADEFDGAGLDLGWGETDADRRPLALVRNPADPRESAALAELLTARPDALVVHTGVPAAAPEVAHLVVSHGASRASVRGVVAAIADATGAV